MASGLYVLIFDAVYGSKTPGGVGHDAFMMYNPDAIPSIINILNISQPRLIGKWQSAMIHVLLGTRTVWACILLFPLSGITIPLRN